MTDRKTAQRANQRRRTRKDLLDAAARLLQDGRSPDMDEVAQEAMVSRATAYRYFPTIEALLIEAPLDGAMPAADEIFDNTQETPDVVERVDQAEAALHEMVCRNEAQLRLMLAASIQREDKRKSPTGVPVRQNRRGPLIEAALSPARDQLDDETYEMLCAALAMIFGVESMIVFRDVLNLDEQAARKIKSWAARSLVSTALKESKTHDTEP